MTEATKRAREIAEMGSRGVWVVRHPDNGASYPPWISSRSGGSLCAIVDSVNDDTHDLRKIAFAVNVLPAALAVVEAAVCMRAILPFKQDRCPVVTGTSHDAALWCPTCMALDAFAAAVEEHDPREVNDG